VRRPAAFDGRRCGGTAVPELPNCRTLLNRFACPTLATRSFMLEARIHVTLKKSVLDPQGETVKSGLASLGFRTVEDCRVGKFMVLRLNETDPTAAKAKVDEMCRKLLANPVSEEYVFQIDEVAG